MLDNRRDNIYFKYMQDRHVNFFYLQGFSCFGNMYKKVGSGLWSTVVFNSP